MSNLIVTRHAPLVEWLKRQGIEGKVITQATEQDVVSQDVYGILPLWLAARAHSITEVSMPRMSLEDRKRVAAGDFTVEEMDGFGAEMRCFVVKEIAHA